MRMCCVTQIHNEYPSPSHDLDGNEICQRGGYLLMVCYHTHFLGRYRPMACTFSWIAVCPMASPLGLWKNVVIPHVLYHTTNSHRRRLAIGVVIHASLTLSFVRCLLCVMVLCIIRSSVEREGPKSQVAGCNSKRAKRVS